MVSVDVAIPNYNYGRYLAACIESVLSQDVESLRLVVIDNASTDESAAIASRYAASDPRVEVRLRSVNRGQHSSFNEAVDWARSEYFLILCSDDMLVPGALRRAVDAMQRNPDLAFVHGRDLPIGEQTILPVVAAHAESPSLRKMDGLGFIERFCRMGVFRISSPTVVVRTAIQKRVGYYRPELPHTDDYDVWLRLATHGSVGELDCVQAMIRRHGQNRSEALGPQLLHIQHTAAAAECFFVREGAQLAGATRLHRLARRGLAGRAYWAAASGALRGERGAAELFIYAIGRNWTSAVLPPVAYLLNRPDTTARMLAWLNGLAPTRWWWRLRGSRGAAAVPPV